MSSLRIAPRIRARPRAPRWRSTSAALAVFLTLAGVAGAAPSASLPPLPAKWPRTLQIGLTEDPGSHVKPLGFRYQYLAGGVNTGSGWATWNPNGTFASMYVQDSWAHGVIPVLTYYMLLQSKPGGGDELHADLTNLRNPSTMAAYWRDVTLMFQRVRGAKPVVVHVEPDLWGYLEQAGARSLARSFAHRLIALRNRLAPRVALAWHLSVWGTKEDPTYSKPSLEHMRALGARSAAFYRSLRAHFDLVFNDVTDRDAGFYQHVEGNPRTWWGPADFRRHDVYIAAFTRRVHRRVVLWQLPLGNTSLPDSWGRYRDNRLQWWLGTRSGAPSSAVARAHLRATRNSGVIGLLFGGGADGTTSDQSDGGFFFAAARSYEHHPLRLRWRQAR